MADLKRENLKFESTRALIWEFVYGSTLYSQTCFTCTWFDWVLYLYHDLYDFTLLYNVSAAYSLYIILLYLNLCCAGWIWWIQLLISVRNWWRSSRHSSSKCRPSPSGIQFCISTVLHVYILTITNIFILISYFNVLFTADHALTMFFFV